MPNTIMFKSLALIAALVPIGFAATTINCGAGQLCPQSTPCCSQYGQCGVGAYCLGGCDPLSSFSLGSCMPEPVCESKTYNFDNLDGIVANTAYLGDASTADWVSSGQPVEYNGNVLLTMAQGTVGTLLASTHYVWYGKVGAKFQTSAGAGVVTAFILLSDVKDEIDFEFIGVDLNHAQTNFYSLGVTNYNNEINATVPSNTQANYHDYEIDWQPDTLTWSVDGNVVRTLKKADTWNATANRYTFPQTPARVQLSLWPAGLSSNGQGTVDWAGGLVDWQSQYMTNGYYYAAFDSVSISCYNPPSGANVQGSTSYIISDKLATNQSVETTDQGTVLQSFLGSGLNANKTSPSASGSASASASATDVATVPGLSGAGTGSNGARGGDDASSSSSSGSSGTASSGNAASTGFVQGTNKNNAPATEASLQGSFLAVVVAIIGLCVL